MRMRRLLLPLLLPLGLFSQPCRIYYEYNDPASLSKNKVKEVRIYIGEKNKNNPTPTYHYYFNNDGCAQKLIHYDHFAKKEGPLESEFMTRYDGLETSLTHGRRKSDTVLLLHSVYKESLSSTGKLWKKVSNNFDGIRHDETELLDTTGSGRIYKYSVHTHPQDWDTLYTILDTYDLTTKIHLLRHKKEGKWIETEKSITRFEDGQFKEYTLFKNGVQVQHFTSDDQVLKQHDQEGSGDLPDENGLPVPDEPIDTVFADVTGATSKVKGKTRKNAKYMIVLHFDHPDKKKVHYADVFYNKSGLKFMRIIYTNLALNEVWEYVYY